MTEENINQEFRRKSIDETRNYFIGEINQNELIGKKYKKVGLTLNDIEHLLILASAVTGCVSNSAFASFVSIPIGITISAVGLKICGISSNDFNSLSKVLIYL